MHLKSFPEHSLAGYFSRFHYNNHNTDSLIEKKKVSKVSNKKGTLNGIKYSLSPFFTFWFHQDTLLKHLSTLTFFHTCDKKAWVGGERNSQKKPEWGKSSFN